MTRRHSAFFALVAAALGALALVSSAAALTPETGVADDRLLLAGGAPAERAVREWSSHGVDVVRIFARWSTIAPGLRAASKPAGFDGADPQDPRYTWEALDAAVRRVRDARMRVMLTVTGPGPLWSSAEPSRKDPRWRPRPAAFADFATAVARRYGADVDRYIVWNEPNQPLWLMPQSVKRGGRWTPEAPHVYRGLVRAAYPAIKAADPGAMVLIGALAPLGSEGRSASAKLRPLSFLRAMGCVTSSYTKVRTGPCKGFRSATGDAVAYHPHGGRLSPGTPYANRDDANLASLGRLESTLDRLQRAGALHATSTHFNLYLDEYGYQTNPPDRLLGVAPATQDRWLQEGAYRASRDPRVKNLTQYVWVDEPVSRDGSYSGWQSGLRFANGKAKPALDHFAMPLWLDTSRNRLWGDVRAATRSTTVTIERKAKGSASWKTVTTVRTDARGGFTKSLKLVSGSSYRYTAAGKTSRAAKR